MEWTVVFTSNQPHLIEIVKNLLNENSVKFVTLDKRDSMYTSFIDPGIEVYVNGEDVIKTKQILSQLEDQ